MINRKLRLTLVAAITAILAMAIQTGAALAGPDDPPAKTDHQLFLRNDDSASCLHIYLSDSDGPDAGDSCAWPVWTPPEVADWQDDYPAEADTGEVSLPITIDATKPITGSIAIGTLTPNDVQLDVYVQLDATRLGPYHVDTGPYASSFFLDSAPTVPISIPIPAALDKKDVSSVTVSIVWGQELNVGGSVWLELDAPPTSVTIPAYDKSWTEFCATHTC
ncbi:MAG: hypothetical protein ABR600_07590 [Actinomycetota bacterium]